MKVLPGLPESLHGILCAGYKGCSQGGYVQTGPCNIDQPFSLGSGNKLLSDGCHSLWGREVGKSCYCAFGPAELWHACRRFSVTFLCTLSACFSLSSAFAFVPKLLLLPREKKQTNNPTLLFNCLSL